MLHSITVDVLADNSSLSNKMYLAHSKPLQLTNRMLTKILSLIISIKVCTTTLNLDSVENCIAPFEPQTAQPLTMDLICTT